MYNLKIAHVAQAVEQHYGKVQVGSASLPMGSLIVFLAKDWYTREIKGMASVFGGIAHIFR